MKNKKPEILKKCFALTGSIATGKSTVAKLFEEIGVKIVDTDKIARDVVKPGEKALKQIAEHFGHDFLLSDGTLNREKMRNEIIINPGKRKSLNEITHPFIMEETVFQAEQFIKNQIYPVIIDVPLLFETHWHTFFQTVILAYVPEKIQIVRLMKRDDLDNKTALSTIAMQINIEEKKKNSNIIIDNSGSIEETKKQVKICYNKLN